MERVALYEVIFAVLCLLSCPLATNAWHNGVTFNGYEYRASEGHFDWANSVFICEREGGYIARIDSSIEQEFIRNYLDSIEGETRAWIGLYTNGHPGTESLYEWVEGDRAVPFSNWQSGEPSNSDQEWCVEIRASHTWEWNNKECDARRTVLCKIPL